MRSSFAALCFLGAQAQAGGLDATGQSVAFMFREGTVVALGFGAQRAEVSGRDAAFLGGSATGGIFEDIVLPSLSVKHDISDRLSVGILIDRPFLGDIDFGPTSPVFAGTRAEARTVSMTALLSYRATKRFSLFGGARAQWAEAAFDLGGTLYGPVSGYRAELDRDLAFGYVLGAAFEMRDYGLRTTLSYNSAIEHSLPTTEALGTLRVGSEVTTRTPQSVNVEFVSGVAPATFVFGGVRWVDWSALQVAPPLLSGLSPDPLVAFNDTVTFTLGIGRKFSETWTSTGALIHEPPTDRRTTPLTPVDGFRGLSLGAIHARGDSEMHLNVTHLRLGDADPYVGALGRSVSAFSGNTSTRFEVKFVHRF